jgi:hypothetical protein
MTLWFRRPPGKEREIGRWLRCRWGAHSGDCAVAVRAFHKLRQRHGSSLGGLMPFSTMLVIDDTAPLMRLLTIPGSCPDAGGVAQRCWCSIACWMVGGAAGEAARSRQPSRELRTLAPVHDRANSTRWPSHNKGPGERPGPSDKFKHSGLNSMPCASATLRPGCRPAPCQCPCS